MSKATSNWFPTKAMKYHDVSVPIHAGMPIFEGDPSVETSPFSSIGKGDLANVTQLLMGTHTGTHMDAPRHFLDNGTTVDEIPLDILIGPAEVTELAGIRGISRDDLASANLEGEERVLFKTSNSRLWREPCFRKDFSWIAGDAARYLVEIGVKLVGIDYLSVERYGASEPVAHLTLLRAGIVIVEGLNLSEVKPGRYELICLPLLIKGGDGSPCRAILVER
jgi:arylformamidase